MDETDKKYRNYLFTVAYNILHDDLDCMVDVSYSDEKPVKEIYFSNNVKRIEQLAFMAFWQLEKVVLPDSIEYIGERAFMECGIKSIELPGNPNLSLQSSLFDYSKLEELTLREGATRLNILCIGNCEFLKAIRLPSTLTYGVLPAGFESLPSLEAIYYNGTVEQWTALNPNRMFYVPVICTNGTIQP